MAESRRHDHTTRPALLLVLALSNCTVLNPRHLPRPPGGRRLTLERAQRYVRKMNTLYMHNRRYYRAYPR